jgi:hypothetical protein
MNATQPAHARHAPHPAAQPSGGGAGQIVALVLSWTAVGVPLAWGVAETLNKALALFR